MKDQKKFFNLKRPLAMLLVCVMLTSLMLVTGCGKSGSSKFEFELNEDGHSYSLIKYSGKDSSVEIPSTYMEKPVTSIGGFGGNSKLTSVTIPDSVSTIRANAFSNCVNLTSVDIPSSVTRIENYAFSSCNHLENITLPNNITYIGSQVFHETKYLKNNANWQNGVLYMGKYLIKANVSGSYKVKDGTTLIAGMAFSGCDITDISIPHTVTVIGDSAFYLCGNLEKIDVSTSACITYIGGSAFFGTEYYEMRKNKDGEMYIGNCLIESFRRNDVVVKSGTTFIASGAFGSEVKSVFIPDSVINMDNPFVDCTELESITVASGNPMYYSSGNCLIEKINYNVIAGCKNSVIPSDGSIFGIGSRAFYKRAGLTSISIPDGVKSIGFEAFLGCKGITSVTIPSSVTSIGDKVFQGCDLESITVAEGNSAYSSAGNCLIEKSTKTLIAGCKNSVIPSDGSVTSIGDRAFFECKELTSVSIPDSVTSIGDSSFYHCEGLTSVTLSKNLKSIGSSAFSGCTGLTSITIPKSVKSIGDGDTFNGCKNLKINYRGSEKQWKAIKKSNFGNHTINYNYTGE